jgi:hypothetical protein
MGIGTKVVKNTAENEVKDVADKAVDRGPADKMEDKADDAKDKAIHKGVKKAF